MISLPCRSRHGFPCATYRVAPAVRLQLCRLLTALALFCVGVPVSAATFNMIARVDVKDVQGGSEIRILFAEPLLYVGHQPLKSGERLTIRLRPLADTASFARVYKGKQSLRQTPTPLVPLTNVLYLSKTGDRATVILEFERPVRYKVKGNKRGDSVTITLPSIVIKGTPPEPLTTAPGDVSLAGHYIVNLESSDTAVPIWIVPHHELFDRYRLYTRKVRIDGKIWERLRLGFFPDKASARAAAQALADLYPGAWVSMVPRNEKVLSARTVVKPTDSAGVTGPSSVARATEEDGKRWYAIHLESRTTPYDRSTLPDLSAFASLIPYVADTQRGATVRHNLRLGFFPSVPDAREVAKQLRDRYPALQIVRVTEIERNVALQPQTPLQTRPVEKVEPPVSAERKTTPSSAASKTEQLYQLSRQALTAGEYRKAIGLLTKLLQMQDHEHRQEAQELLGFARERNGQIAHAKAEYETYLRLYPDTEGSQRVRQRLAGLVTATRTPAETPAATQPQEKPRTWEWYGSVSQFYWRDTDYTDEDGEMVSVSELSSFALLSSRRRTDAYDIRAQFSADDRRDFLDEDDDTRVLDAFLDLTDRRRDYFARLGRQTRRSGGVLGRFDGVFAGYNVSDLWTANVVAGVPVETFDTDLDVDKTFYGLSADAVYNDALDLSAFFIEQTADGLTDRQAVGGELRYFNAAKSVVGLVDYDVFYDQTNIAFLSGTWTFSRGDSVYGSIDYRTSPLLTTSNALQGQTVSSLDALRDTFTTSEIQDIAEDRTATSESLSLGASHPFTDSLEGTLDATFATLSETDASAGVEAAPSSRGDYYVLQLIKNELASPADVAVLGLRYTDTDTSDTYAILTSYRLPLNGWRINPKGQLESRENKDDDNYRKALKLAMRADYRARRNLRIDVELGVQWFDEEVAEDDQDSSRYFVNFGYYWDF